MTRVLQGVPGVERASVVLDRGSAELRFDPALIDKMIVDDRYFIDILTQVSAVQRRWTRWRCKYSSITLTDVCKSS